MGQGIDLTILWPYHDLTMKAALLTAPGKLEIREIPKPQIHSDEILIRVRACAICGTDLRIYRYGHRKIELPAIIGHEIVGRVEEVGAEFPAEEVDYGPGEMVMVTPGIPCGRCSNCLRGLFCSHKTSIAYHYPGGFAEYLLARSREITGKEGFDVVIVACSSPEIQEQSLELIGLYGKVLYFAGLPPNHPRIHFNSNLLHYKLASVRGTYGSTLYQNRLAMEMIASGFTERLCDSRYPLEQISEAFQRAGEGRTLKTVIEPWGIAG